MALKERADGEAVDSMADQFARAARQTDRQARAYQRVAMQGTSEKCFFWTPARAGPLASVEGAVRVSTSANS